MGYVYNSDVSSIVGFIEPYYALVTKNMDNMLYCDIECFNTKANKKHFKEGTIIEINGIHGGTFRISNPTITGKRLKARCYSLFEDTKNYTIHNLVLVNEPISSALEKLIKACDSAPIIVLYTDFSDDVTVTCTFEKTTLSEALLMLAELTGGFLKTRGRNIDLLQDSGKTLIQELRYGDNIKSFKKIEDWSNVCTKIFPIGYDGITLDEVYVESETQYTRPYTKIVEFEQEVVVDDAKINSAEYNTALKTELKAFAEAYLQIYAEPETSYEVEAHVDFDIDVGDILPVYYPKLAFNKKVQVQEIQWDAISRKYKSVKFGKLRPTITGLYSDLTVRSSGDVFAEGVWHKLKLSDNFAAYDGENANHPEYKGVGGIVSVRGLLTVGEAIQSSKSYITMATGIPKEYRPSKDVKTLCQGSGSNKWLCTITTDGKVQISRYGVTEYISIPADAWLPFNITYLI